MPLTIYSQPGCSPCKNTIAALERAEVPHQVRDITADPDALAAVLALGYQQTPVVVIDADNHWSGHNPSKLAALIAAPAAA